MASQLGMVPLHADPREWVSLLPMQIRRDCKTSFQWAHSLCLCATETTITVSVLSTHSIKLHFSFLCEPTEWSILGQGQWDNPLVPCRMTDKALNYTRLGPATIQRLSTSMTVELILKLGASPALISPSSSAYFTPLKRGSGMTETRKEERGKRKRHSSKRGRMYMKGEDGVNVKATSHNQAVPLATMRRCCRAVAVRLKALSSPFPLRPSFPHPFFSSLFICSCTPLLAHRPFASRSTFKISPFPSLEGSDESSWMDPNGLLHKSIN